MGSVRHVMSGPGLYFVLSTVADWRAAAAYNKKNVRGSGRLMHRAARRVSLTLAVTILKPAARAQSQSS